MAEYISREALLERLDMASDCKNCPRCVDMKTYYDRCAYTDIQDVCSVISDMPAADVQPIDFVQNEVLNYLINKEREAESMPYSDVRQERIATLREVIRYVEGIGDTNG